MTNLEMREMLKQIIIENMDKYNYIAVRGTYEKLEIGEILDTSYQWDWENDISTYDTDEPIELGGVCAVNLDRNSYFNNGWINTEEEMEEAIDYMVKMIEAAKKAYYGTHYSIIVSNDRNPLGFDENDNNEIILADAKVVGVIK